MAPRPSIELSGVCLRCRQAVRKFSTSQNHRQFGPEHPRHVEIPIPPQQTAETRSVPKGILPVPRSLFGGKQGIRESRDKSVRLSTREQKHGAQYVPPTADSFLSWKDKISAQRRENLRDGVEELRRRHEVMNRRRDHQSKTRAKEREEAVNRPVRDDERLTAGSNNFDYDSLLRGEIREGDRAKLMRESKRRFEVREARKKQERFQHLHTLFTKASSFITRPEQLDTALEEAFGTDENPVTFAQEYSKWEEAHSIWAHGKPVTIQELLRSANKVGDGSGQLGPEQLALREARLKKVAETLTGGTMAD
ncbi:hypothetical protein AMS68_002811 [Peltaster fructicola]|uniref:Uncharacterized protein n=1 Tax=Peltaster fructicola TaxID=286661 RepID=A0A6H0XRD7_9PEZI|nr:hypothetical protein AMS68_002811 [Peltaster fructicola]